MFTEADMRLIGYLQNETSAKTLADYLVSLDIRNLVEPEGEKWAVWVYSEDQIEAGRQALATYLSNPADAKFQKARQAAAILAEQDRRENAGYEKRLRTADDIWVSTSVGPITLTLIILSVIATLVANVESTAPMAGWLMISQYPFGVLPEVQHGQIWRLITPIFLHSGIMHIFFNMWMLRDLGTLVERRRGPMIFIALVVTIAIGSNLGQYFYSGPGFGGMSGVLFGLLGYAWVRGQCDPDSGLQLSPMTIAMMLVWFFLCLMNVIPGVANACHAVGLIMGMLIGAAPLAKQIF